MKCLAIITHGSAKQALVNCLLNINEVKNFTLNDCERQQGEDIHDPFLSTWDGVVGYVPMVRVDLFLQDDKVKQVLEKLRQPDSGLKGLGEYRITAIENQGHL